MSITVDIRMQVRERAMFACEFCGVTESDVGGQLTIDHFQPKTKGGSDNYENLIYCCTCCNQYKLDYWPTKPNDLSLWNPHLEPFSKHFLELDDGTLYPLTQIGSFTLKRIRLNRPPLVNYRLQKIQKYNKTRLLKRYRDLIQLLEKMHIQLFRIIEEQQELLKEQKLLQLLKKDKDI
jgi:hypothetical protein